EEITNKQTLSNILVKIRTPSCNRRGKKNANVYHARISSEERIKSVVKYCYGSRFMLLKYILYVPRRQKQIARILRLAR
ncbi:40653_t:CDS:1, partial [Gigaspora margarita]